jgi:hypothetical protein
VCLVVDKLAAASKLLAARGLRPEEEEVLELQLANRPGALGQVARSLGEAGVNIKYVFWERAAVAGRRSSSRSPTWPRPSARSSSRFTTGRIRAGW